MTAVMNALCSFVLLVLSTWLLVCTSPVTGAYTQVDEIESRSCIEQGNDNDCPTSPTPILTEEERYAQQFPGMLTYDYIRHDSDDDPTVCVNDRGETRRLPLGYKQEYATHLLSTESHPEWIVKHLCTLDVSPIRQRLEQEGQDAFSDALHRQTNAKFTNRKDNMNTFKPGVTAMILIFSNRRGTGVYHFPWLESWLPLLQENVLTPLHIPLSNIVRMQFANMTVGSTINPHVDMGLWVSRTHRVHVPITTHDFIYFLAETPVGEYVRIKSQPGQVFEVNNAIKHQVRNFGGNRVHLIIDWAETLPEYTETLKPGQVCSYNGPQGVLCED